MAISYPLSLPAAKSPSRIVFGKIVAVTVSRSPMSYVSQVQRFSGQLWTAEITLPIMEREDAEQWVAFLLKLNGQEGTFLLGETTGKVPMGVATGTPRLVGAHARGVNSLSTDGWTNSVTNILKAGDYIQIGQRIHKNLSDVNSSSGGAATLDIWPRLREDAADNALITVSDCVGLFRLDSNSMQLFNVDSIGHRQVSFSAVEAV